MTSERKFIEKRRGLLCDWVFRPEVEEDLPVACRKEDRLLEGVDLNWAILN